MILYRPVGLQELELIYDSGMKAFPARLPQQPIFYPVLQLEYARQIASDWNAKSGQAAGYVTEFKVEDPYISQFEKHTAGGARHEEFWIPAEELEEFNRHITGHIKVLEAYFGDGFQGFVPEKFGLEGKDAVAQFTLLANSYIYKRMDFYLEIKRNHKAVFLNYPFWQKYDFKNQGLKGKVLQAIREAWLTSFPQTPLVSPVPGDTPSEKETDTNSLGGPAQEEPPSTKQKDPSLARPARQDTLPIKQKESQAPMNPAREASPLVNGIDSHTSANPANEEAAAAPQSASHSSFQPVPEETPPSMQKISHYEQGVQLGLSGKYHEAIDELSRAVEEAPQHAAAHTCLGVAFHRVGEDDRALACYETALKFDPKSAEAHYFRANILYSRGNVREGMAGYMTAIGLQPELIEAHQKSGPEDRLTDYTGSPAEMYRIARPAYRILDLNKTLETNPRQADIFKERAAEYTHLGNYEQAIADYSSSLAIQPDDATVLHLRGLAYEQIGQPDRARQDYQRAVAIDPQLSNAYINRGVDFGKMGNFRQSIDSLTEGIRLAPDNPNGYFNRGTTYFQLGDLESAIADFSMVIQLASNDEAAYYWRGVSNEEAGRQREAIADYRRFLNLSQDQAAREEIEQKLRQWSVSERDRASRHASAQQDRQTTIPVQSKRPDEGLDLHDLIVALGERALNSKWFGSDVECSGEKAEELFAFTDEDQPIEGRDFLNITSGIRQTIEGDFQAFDPGAASPWIFIRAWDGKGFYIETNDPKIKKRLQTHFQSAEEVEGAASPYEGLFIHI